MNKMKIIQQFKAVTLSNVLQKIMIGNIEAVDQAKTLRKSPESSVQTL